MAAPVIVTAPAEPDITEVTVELSDDQIVYSDDTLFVEGGIKPPVVDEDLNENEDEDEDFEEWEGEPHHHSHYSSSYPY